MSIRELIPEVFGVWYEETMKAKPGIELKKRRLERRILTESESLTLQHFIK